MLSDDAFEIQDVYGYLVSSAKYVDIYQIDFVRKNLRKKALQKFFMIVSSDIDEPILKNYFAWLKLQLKTIKKHKRDSLEKYVIAFMCRAGEMYHSDF